MESQIKSVVFEQDEIKLVDLFGYSTNGIPGVEIHGLGKWGRSIKEKFVFLTRRRKVSLPIKRYVLCLADTHLFNDLGKKDLSALELPLLIMYWQLAGLIKIRDLGECLAAGSITSHGRVQERSLSYEHLVEQHARDQFKIYINSGQFLNLDTPFFEIDTGELLGAVPDLSFCS